MQQLDPKAYWMFLRVPLAVLVGVFVFTFYAYLAPFGYYDVAYINFIRNNSWIVIVGLVLFAIGSLIWAKLAYKNYRYELTEDGFRKEMGVILKQYTTVPYDRIQNIDIRQGLLARILGLSELDIQTAAGLRANTQATGILPGLSPQVAEELREELIKRSRQTRNQGV